MAIKKSQLYSTLWESCNALRGSMDASQYKDYVLIILFVKYLSDKAKQNKIRLKVPEGCYFEDFVALKRNKHIGEEINKKLEEIRSANATFIGDLTLPNFNDEAKFGDAMVDTLTKLIGEFERDELDFSLNRAADDDLLGDAYEYLMKNFAAESGKSKGQFYTPAEVSRVMAKVLHLEDLTHASDSIYDPTCGSGSLLLRALAETPRGNVSLRGQEKDSTTASLAKLNMLLHGIVSANIKIGDTLNSPKFTSGGSIETFNVCVANPPFSLKNWMAEGGEKDLYHRWDESLLAPPKCGDFAFLQHLIASMSDEGRGACILPHGVLFRGNAEYSIRKDIVKRHLIKGIIGLPSNLFFGTGIPASIIIIDKKGADEREGIFFIDAKDGFIKDGAKNRLREQDIKRIVDVWDKQLEIPHYSKFVMFSDIEKNDYNLNIPRYITPIDTEIQQDIYAHLHGGLPKSDIDKMESYWSVCPSLKGELFSVNEGNKNYFSLRVSKAKISETIAKNDSFITQKELFQKSLNEWADYVRPSMTNVKQGVNPKKLIGNWGEKLLAISQEDKSLVDAYSVYDHLMTYWGETMQDDCYLIANDGWVIPDVVPEKKNALYCDIVCDLLPVEIVLKEFFSEELADITDCQNKIDSKGGEIDALVEEFAEKIEEVLEKLSEASVKKVITASKKKEITIEDDTLDILNRYLSLSVAKKELTSKLKHKQLSLTKAVIEKYQSFSENDLKTLVVDKKWIQEVMCRCNSEMISVAENICNTVESVSERYEETLQGLTVKMNELDTKVMSHLKDMGFEL